jgi:hypothetical protein
MMASKKTGNAQNKANNIQEKRRMRVLQIIVIIFSLMLILSMVLSAVSNSF